MTNQEKHKFTYDKENKNLAYYRGFTVHLSRRRVQKGYSYATETAYYVREIKFRETNRDSFKARLDHWLEINFNNCRQYLSD